MRRAGWSVWMAYDLPGSFEEMPPNLIDELSRDHRWCQGNLMNMRLFLMKGLHPAHRAVFMTGVMAYLSAPLWLLSLILATALVAVQALTVPQYFVQPFQLFPLWPEWRPSARSCCFDTVLVLFLPKILASLLVQAKRIRGSSAPRAVGARWNVSLSALLAPVRMLFHSPVRRGLVAGARGALAIARTRGCADRLDASVAAPRRPYDVRHRLDGARMVARPPVSALVAAGRRRIDAFGTAVRVTPVARVQGGHCAGLACFSFPKKRKRRRCWSRPEDTFARHAGRGIVAAVVDPIVNAVACAHGGGRQSSKVARWIAARSSSAPSATASTRFRRRAGRTDRRSGSVGATASGRSRRTATPIRPGVRRAMIALPGPTGTVPLRHAVGTELSRSPSPPRRLNAARAAVMMAR